MRRQILNIALAVVAICLVGVVSVAASSPTDRFWHFGDFFSSNESLWTAMGSDFQLDHGYMVDNRYVEKQIHWFLHQRAYLHELTRNARPYIYYVLQQTQKRGMPAEIALMPMIESNYNPFEFSNRGAVGVWQLMPGTASGFGLRINWWYDGRRDVVAATNAALNYLQYLHDYFHTWLLAIAAYDAGEGTVISAIRYNRRHHLPTDFWALHLPYETKTYVPKLLALATVIKHHHSYGVQLVPVNNKPFFSTVTVKTQINLARVAKLAETPSKIVRKLNAGFRRWATAPDRTYNLLVPVKKASVLQTNLAQAKQEKPVEQPQLAYHRVRSGESLSAIASRYDTTIGALRHLNKLQTNVLQIGEDLLIPVAEATPLEPDHVHSKIISEDGIPGPKRIVHVVKSHETVGSIARLYHVRSSNIYFWNNLDGHERLHAGQQLILWKKKSRAVSAVQYNGGFYHRVRRGESLDVIARRYHTTTRNLRRTNRLQSNTLQIGERLYIS